MSKRSESALTDIGASGWKVLSGEYKNLDTTLTLECPKGHKLVVSYGEWRDRKRCPICWSNDTSLMLKSPKDNKNCKARVLSIDDATNVSGYAIYDDDNLVNYGSYMSLASTSSDRIYEMTLWVEDLISKWQPDIIVIEDIQRQWDKNPQTYKQLAKLQGALEYIIKRSKIKYQIVYSSTWKSFCDIIGKTRKDQKKDSMKKAMDWYGIECTEDEGDAICMGRYAARGLLT